MKKKSNYILILVLSVSMVLFNFAFNIFTNATNVFKEELKFTQKNVKSEVSFSKKKDTLDVIKVMEYLEKNNMSNFITYNQSFNTHKKESGFSSEYIIEMGLVTNKDLVNYPILKGRNFSQEEISDGAKVILLPYIFEHLTYENNNKKFIDIQGEKYEVIGIIKSLMGESFHQLNAYIPYTAKPNNVNLIGFDNSISIFVDSKEIDNIDNLNLQTFDISNFSTTRISPAPITNRLKFFSRDYQNFIIIFIASIVNVLLFSIYWVKCRQRTNYIYKILGYTNKDINKIVLKETAPLILIVVLVSNITYYLIEKFFASSITNLTICWSVYMILANLLIGIALILMLLIITNIFLTIKNTSIDKKFYFSNNKIIKVCIIFQIIAMTLNFIGAYRIFNEHISTINFVNRIEKTLENDIFFIDSFSITHDMETIKNLEIEDMLFEFEKNNIKTLNYLYSYEQIDKEKNPKFNLYQNNLKKKRGEKIYIDEVENEPIFLYIKDDYFNKSVELLANKQSIPVVLGKDFKKYYSLNDNITMANGVVYTVVDFLEDEIFYYENNNSMHLVNTVSLDNVILVPFKDINEITKISGFYNDKAFLESTLIRNTLYSFPSNEEKLLVEDILKGKNVKLISKDYALDFYNQVYFDGVIFQFVLSITTFFIALIGILSYITIIIEENSKKFRIQYSLGYRISHILKEIILKIILIFIIGDLLTIVLIKLQRFGYVNFSTIKFMILSLLISLIIIYISTHMKLKKFKSTDLLKEE